MPTPNDRLGQLLEELRVFVQERDWEQFHDPKNLAMALASEAGELLAEYRWVHSSEADAIILEPERLARIRAEVADVAIALLCLCDRLGLDIVDIVRYKLETNRANYPVEVSRGRSERPS